MKMTSVEFEVVSDAPLHSPPVFAGFFLWLVPRVAFAVETLLPLGLFCFVIAELHDTSARKRNLLQEEVSFRFWFKIAAVLRIVEKMISNISLVDIH